MISCRQWLARDCKQVLENENFEQFIPVIERAYEYKDKKRKELKNTYQSMKNVLIKTDRWHKQIHVDTHNERIVFDDEETRLFLCDWYAKAL